MAYSDLFRSIAPLTLVFVPDFAVPRAGLSMPGPIAAWPARRLVLAAFAEEVFWTAILWSAKGRGRLRSFGLGFGFDGTRRYVV